MIIITEQQNYGPFASIEVLADRLHADGVDYPLSVIGPYTISDDDSGAPAVPAPVAVPASVTRRQARQALFLAGLLDAVPLAIAQLPSPHRELALIEWDDSLEFLRARPLVISIGTAIGLDSAGLDALFITAAGL